MPINRSEFEKGELDPGFVLEEFLRSNDDYAYTIDEIIVELSSKRMALTAEEVQGILSDLEKHERIIKNRVRDIMYYIYRKPISSRTS